MDSIRNCVNISKSAKSPLVVVVSALGGITDLIIHAMEESAKKRPEVAAGIARKIEERYRSHVNELISKQEIKNRMLSYISSIMSEFRRVNESIGVLGECTPQSDGLYGRRGRTILSKIISIDFGSRWIFFRFSSCYRNYS